MRVDRNEVVWVVNAPGTLAAMTETGKLSVLQEGNKTNSRTTALVFRRADDGLFRELFDRISQETALGSIMKFALPHKARVVL